MTKTCINFAKYKFGLEDLLTIVKPQACRTDTQELNFYYRAGTRKISEHDKDGIVISTGEDWLLYI